MTGATWLDHAKEVMGSLVRHLHNFAREVNLTHAEWNKGIAFQRLEFLGDAFLQFAVSMELRKRYPDKSDGELTSIRSALVRNVNLGRLLRRRSIDPGPPQRRHELR